MSQQMENFGKPRVYLFLPWSRMGRISIKIVIVSPNKWARVDERVQNAIHKRPGSRRRLLESGKSQKIFTLKSTCAGEPWTAQIDIISYYAYVQCNPVHWKGELHVGGLQLSRLSRQNWNLTHERCTGLD